MSVSALQDFTFVSRYANFNESKKRRETWEESITRVKEMHQRRYPQIHDDIEWAFNQSLSKRVLGSQRALQFGGKPIEKHNARLYNCCASYCDRLRFFQETFFLLLCGCGVGESVQKHHIDKLPLFLPNVLTKGKKVYIIQDSIEGWADALGVLLSSYFPTGDFSEYEGYQVVFEYHLIREKGSPLKSSTGKAPGPIPLRNALEKIRLLLTNRLNEDCAKLKPINAYDIIMHSSDAVLSGGVRRSANLTIFSPDDEEMLTAKTGNWFYENPQRGRSNNSALLLRDSTSKETFVNLIKSVREFGEPGFIWSDDLEQLFNPCVEVSLYGYDEFGNSGFEFCNLCEINGSLIKSESDFEIACRAGAIIGTCQAGYTDFPYLGDVSERIAKREALLGVSITGMMDSPDIIFDPSIQREMGQLILDVNAEFASKIGINATSRATVVKPSGTASCVLGCASGIHPHHSKRYFRNVQSNTAELPVQFFKNINPLAIEDSVWSANKTDSVLTFCIEAPDNAKLKEDLKAVDLLEYVKLTQQNWVASGKRPGASVKEFLSHNVSNTCMVGENEWEEVANYIYDNRHSFAGISLLPSTGDLDYQQAPFIAVHTPKELVNMYGDGVIMASGLIVDGLHAFENNLWNGCSAVFGTIDPKNDLQKDWIRRVNQFAERYLNNDLKKTCYLMKEVSNWKKWCDLRREYQEVDYSKMVEVSDNTSFTAESACAGGKCEF